jgi:hypothetical protein
MSASDAERDGRARFIKTVSTADDLCKYVRRVTESPAEAVLGLLMAARTICEGLPTHDSFEEYCRVVSAMQLHVLVRKSVAGVASS